MLVGQPPSVYTRNAVLRVTLVSATLSLIVLLACRDGEGVRTNATLPPSQTASTIVPVTPVAKPSSVPEAARAISQTTALGRIVRRANQAPQPIMTRRLLDASCEADVLTIDTSEETIYASLPCDRFWDRESAEIFVDAEVAIVLEVAEVRFRVLIQTLGGAQAEFTVAGIWVE